MKMQANRGNEMRNDISSETQVEMKGRTREVTERNIKCKAKGNWVTMRVEIWLNTH